MPGAEPRFFFIALVALVTVSDCVRVNRPSGNLTATLTETGHDSPRMGVRPDAEAGSNGFLRAEERFPAEFRVFAALGE